MREDIRPDYTDALENESPTLEKGFATMPLA